MTNSRVMKWVTGSLELMLAIPIIGGAIVISTWYVMLLIMLVLHIITLVLSANNNEPKYGSILGIVTSLVAWIPLLGWTLHLITAILLMVTAAKRSQQIPPPPPYYQHPMQ